MSDFAKPTTDKPQLPGWNFKRVRGGGCGYCDAMKQCSYCGKEYPDEAISCVIDGQELEDPNRVAQEVECPANEAPAVPGMKGIDLVYPEYRWSAWDGWKFLGMMVVIDVAWYYVTGAVYVSAPYLHQLRWSPYGVVLMTTIFVGLKVLTAAYFARTESIRSFCSAVGLDRKPTNYAWFGVAAALGLRLLSHSIYTLGWARGYSDYDLSLFRASHTPDRYLYLFPLLVAAFWEEPVKRGFLYKAFRGTYSIAASIAVILVYTAYAHWNQYAHMGWAVISLSVITAVQCYVREKSDSIWDCILLHLVFNGSSLLVSGLLR